MDGRRREERIAVSLPIRVWGMDATHRPFTQSATTLDLTRAGVRVGGLSCHLQSGDIVGIQHGAEKARFRVVWAGKKGGAQHGQAGLVCIETGKYIWGVPLQRLAAAVKPTLGPRETTVARPESPAPKPEPEKPSERRTDTRYAATGGAEILNVHDGSRLWGVITDVGTSGCYVEMTTPLKAGTSVHLILSLYGTDIHSGGEVRNSHLGVGMGVSFLEMSAEDRHRLDEIVHRLAAGVSVPLAPVPTQTAEAATPPPDPKAIALAEHIRAITGSLRAIDDLIAGSGLAFDERVIREFRRTVDNTRDHTRSVQKWLEEGADQKRVYQLLDELEARRMHSATELIRELAMDVDANALHLGVNGFADLAAAVEQLRKRFVALKQGGVGGAPEAEGLPR